MGISQSSTRFLASQPQDEEEGGSPADYPNLQNGGKSYGESSERFRKILILCRSIYKAAKSLLQQVCKCLRPRERADDLVITIQNPVASSVLCEPLLGNTSEYSITGINDGEEAHYCEINVGVDRNVISDDAVVVSAPQNRCSYTTSMIVRCEEIIEEEEEVFPPNFSPPDQSVGLVKEEVQITSGGDDDAAIVSTPEAKCSYASIVMWRPEINVEETVPASKSREEEKAIVEVVGEVKRIKHYSSQHKILLVGEGDFSFSACLAVAFGSAPNIIATCFNAKAFLKKNYGSAMSNVAELRRRGSRVMYGIDATEIAKHELLRQMKFDRIIFNFPFAGFFRNMTTEEQLRHHRRLVSLFLKNAKEMISEDGEIHVSHKTNGFHAEFKLENIASSHGLRLIAAVKFKSSNYPGYNAKYGFGGDKNFDCHPSKTFKFGLKQT